MINEYDIEDHGDAELQRTLGEGRVTKAQVLHGVLKAYWRTALNQPAHAWFYRGVRMTKGLQGRGYVETDGTTHADLEDAKAHIDARKL